MHFNYLTLKDVEKYAFITIPKALFTDKRYSSMSTEAKVLYGVLLDRTSLSKENGWVDDHGRVFIIFSREAIQDLLGYGKNKVIDLFKELHKVGLIDEVRQGLTKPNIIYVKDFASENKAQSQINQRKFENQTSEGFKNKLQAVSKTNPNNTELNNTENLSNLSNRSICQDDKSDNTDRIDKIDRLETKEKGPLSFNQTKTPDDADQGISELKTIIANNIGYDHLKKRYKNDDLIDNIFDLIIETLSSTRLNIRIGGEDKPRETVMAQLLRLNQFHIEYVIKVFSDSTVKARNIKAYLLTTLYNAPMTMGAYYANLVKHDMGKG